MTILANIYIDGDTAPGLYQFAAIPHRGDRLHIQQGDDVLILTVERVDHYPVPAKLGAANIFGGGAPAVTVFCGVGE
ncbi:hypothetical protein K7W03_26885 [Sphingobium sp. PNB]|uniref:hypothetical protein n=1 Tax=Sphingobium sp. PNB TaxID=863934 RepID=UPI001CA3A476|nr:hypothetical protein [Sphingobium sp. PNB]MCB4863203.1 hypothetical protein [Sphingobium sp. PNB]